MTDAEIVSALKTRIAYHETEAERCRKALAVFEADGPVKGKTRGGGKQTATSKKKRSGEQRPDPTEGKRAARIAEGLAMLKAGKTPEQVSKHFNVTTSAVYLWRKKAGQ